MYAMRSPFGSLIELSYKLKETEGKLLRQFSKSPTMDGGCGIFRVSNVHGNASMEFGLEPIGLCNNDCAETNGGNLCNAGMQRSNHRKFSSEATDSLLKIRIRSSEETSMNAEQDQLLKSNFSSASLPENGKGFKTNDVVKGKHKCPLCGYRTGNRFHLRRHMGSVHNADKAYYCYICEKEFSRSEKVKAHFLNIHPEIPYQSKWARKNAYLERLSYPGVDCPIPPEIIASAVISEMEAATAAAASSDQLLASANNLRRSSNNNLQTTPEKPNSRESGESVTQKSWGKYCHIAGPPFEGRKYFQCNSCMFSGSDIWLMKKHYLDVHVGTELYACRVCRYSSSHRDRLIGHMLGHGELFCFTCFFSTGDLEEFNHHIEECCKPVQCPLCGTSFQTVTHLERHTLETHEMALLVCKLCSFVTISSEELEYHGKSHIVCKPEPEVSKTWSPELAVEDKIEDTDHHVDEATCSSRPNLTRMSKDEATARMLAWTTSESYNVPDSPPLRQSSSTRVYPCSIKGCGFSSSWKKCLELHMENYHNSFFTGGKETGNSDMTSPLTSDSFQSGLFPCPFCPNFRTFKYRKSFEKHLSQHGLDHSKHPYFVTGLNVHNAKDISDANKTSSTTDPPFMMNESINAST